MACRPCIAEGIEMKKHEHKVEDDVFELQIRLDVLKEHCPECGSHEIEVRTGNSPHFGDPVAYLECSRCLHQWDHG
jgi:Zn finger protein HypA/HybF involved in hydrogenase expression